MAKCSWFFGSLRWDLDAAFPLPKSQSAVAYPKQVLGFLELSFGLVRH